MIIRTKKNILVSANPTDPIILPPTLKFSFIFLKKKYIFVKKMSKIQSIVNFNVQSNVPKLLSRLMEVKKKKFYRPTLPIFFRAVSGNKYCGFINIRGALIFVDFVGCADLRN